MYTHPERKPDKGGTILMSITTPSGVSPRRWALVTGR